MALTAAEGARSSPAITGEEAVTKTARVAAPAPEQIAGVPAVANVWRSKVAGRGRGPTVRPATIAVMLGTATRVGGTLARIQRGVLRRTRTHQFVNRRTSGSPEEQAGCRSKPPESKAPTKE